MRVAFFSPLSPTPSGIADYSEALLPHLATRLEKLDVFVEATGGAPAVKNERFRVRHWSEFEREYAAGCYDVVLYQMGNNPFHVYMYDLALRAPGVIVLHEFNLHHLMAHVTIARQDWPAYLRELEYNGGPAALARGFQAQQGVCEPDYNGVAMNRRLLESSIGAVVHSDYVAGLVRSNGFDLALKTIPHGVDATEIDRSRARRHLAQLTGLEIDESTAVVGVFGFLKPYKRIHEALRAFAQVRGRFPSVKMLLVGEEHPHYPLRPLIQELGVGDAVRIAGYVPLEMFTTCIAAADICINLRRPTVGETSGSLLRAMALGKPAIVSEIGAFRELPDDAVVKVPVDDHEVEWVAEYLNLLLEDSSLARAIGERARAYVEKESAWPKVADEYVEFLSRCKAASRPGYELGSVIAANNAPAEPKESHNPQYASRELEQHILSFSRFSPEMEDYAITHRARLVHTLEITPPGTERDSILELGCYLQLTPALRKYLGYGEVRGAYYGSLGRQDERTATSSSGETFSCIVDLFDAEKDRFPYADASFQAVLCCEMIEHLANDPMHMLAEINRILAPGGHLVLTTPNISSFRSLHAVLHGYHPGLFPAYIKPAADGTMDPRHAREYTPRELALMMEAAGFTVDLLETGDYGAPDVHAEWGEKFLIANQCSADLRRDVIYCRGKKTGPVRDRWPKEFYYPA